MHLGTANYLQRYKVYVTHVEAWRQQFEKLESVDLRFDGQIIVNPDLQGIARQPALTQTAAKAALAAGVKNAAIVNYEKYRESSRGARRASPCSRSRKRQQRQPSKAERGHAKARGETCGETRGHQPAPKWQSQDSGSQARLRPVKRGFHVAATPASQKPAVQQTVDLSSNTQTNVPKSTPAALPPQPPQARRSRAQPSQGGSAELVMPSHAPNFITAIDVGSAKTSVLVAELSDNGLRYRGHGVTESRGLRKGVITELDKAVGSIQKAVEAAEDVAGIPIERAIIGIAGAHIRGMNSHGGISFGTRAREIGRDEIRQAVDKARTMPLPADREILHLLPQEFILDDQPGVQDPTGMMATRLEVRVHIVTALSGATQNLVTAVNKAGVHVDDTIFEPLACADSVLRSDERELGVCLADLGAGSCDLIVFQQGAVAHTAVIPIGGDHFTSDLSVGMTTGLGRRRNAEENLRQRRAHAHSRRQRS